MPGTAEQAARELVRKVMLNWNWGRTHGWADLIEEHDWNPAVRVPRDLRKALYARRHPIEPGTAAAVILVGAQRSGTNMIAHGLDQAPEVEVLNEGNGRAFDAFSLRPIAQVQQVVGGSRHPYVLLKPLCDSHRLPELIAALSNRRPARGIWAYRGVDGRVRSHVAKFGDGNLQALRDFAAGRGLDHWQVQGLSPESVRFVRSVDFAELTAASGSALFWYVRNSMFFELDLDHRPDVILARYEAFLAEPESAMRGLCTFLDFRYEDALVAHIRPGSHVQRAPLPLHPAIRERCDDLERRLTSAYERQPVARSA